MTDRTLALSALITLIVGILGSLILALFDAGVSFIFAGASMVLTLIFGIASWKEKVARVAVGTAASAAGLFFLVTMYMLFSWNTKKEDVGAIRSERVLSESSTNRAGKELPRIQRIGEELLQKGAKDEGESSDIDGLVSVQPKLQEKLKELRSELPDPSVMELVSGDLKEPYGDGEADAKLRIGNSEKNIWIRLRYDEKKDAYHVLGWKEGKRD